jgi:hypothetical protein
MFFLLFFLFFVQAIDFEPIYFFHRLVSLKPITD